MKALVLLIFISLNSAPVPAQSSAQKIYETERAFEKMVAEKGLNAAFIEYLAPDGIMFFPEAANGRDTWIARAPSPAALTWNPVVIDVSSNDVLGYSIGNSVFKPKGKDDSVAYSGHYLSIWVRRSNGEYRAVLDTGINHEKPDSIVTTWKSPEGYQQEKSEKKLSAADSSTGFYQLVDSGEASKAFRSYLADEAILMRDGSAPFVGKRTALGHIKAQKVNIKFAKRKSFVEATDLAYVHGLYSLNDKAGAETERGNFAQVWKLRSGKWKIVVDVLIPLTKSVK